MRKIFRKKGERLILEKITAFFETYQLPILIFLGMLALSFLLFQTLPQLRGLRVRARIKRRRTVTKLKHYYYSMLGVVRLFSAIKILLLVFIGIGFLLFLTLLAIDAWNTFLVPRGLPKIGLPFPLWRIFFVMGWILGALMSFFTKPKVKKFADKVAAKPSMIYIFGSNRLTEMLLNKLMSLGMGVRTALIAEKKQLWIEQLPEEINTLILDDPEELKSDTLYEIIQFNNASKIISLVEDPDLCGNLLTRVRKVNPEVELLLLSNNKPPFLDLSTGRFEKVEVIKDTTAILRELTGKLALGYQRPDVISLTLPPIYEGRSPSLIEKDLKKRVKVLGIKRNGELKDITELRSGDQILLYLKEEKVLGDLLQLRKGMDTGITKAESKQGIKMEEAKKTPPTTPEKIGSEESSIKASEGKEEEKEKDEEETSEKEPEKEKEKKATNAFSGLKEKREHNSE